MWNVFRMQDRFEKTNLKFDFRPLFSQLKMNDAIFTNIGANDRKRCLPCMTQNQPDEKITEC